MNKEETLSKIILEIQQKALGFYDKLYCTETQCELEQLIKETIIDNHKETDYNIEVIPDNQYRVYHLNIIPLNYEAFLEMSKLSEFNRKYCSWNFENNKAYLDIDKWDKDCGSVDWNDTEIKLLINQDEENDEENI